jgi:hypothetical protein
MYKIKTNKRTPPGRWLGQNVIIRVARAKPEGFARGIAFRFTTVSAVSRSPDEMYQFVCLRKRPLRVL